MHEMSIRSDTDTLPLVLKVYRPAARNGPYITIEIYETLRAQYCTNLFLQYKMVNAGARTSCILCIYKDREKRDWDEIFLVIDDGYIEYEGFGFEVVGGTNLSKNIDMDATRTIEDRFNDLENVAIRGKLQKMKQNREIVKVRLANMINMIADMLKDREGPLNGRDDYSWKVEGTEQYVAKLPERMLSIVNRLTVNTLDDLEACEQILQSTIIPKANVYGHFEAYATLVKNALQLLIDATRKCIKFEGSINITPLNVTTRGNEGDSPHNISAMKLEYYETGDHDAPSREVCIYQHKPIQFAKDVTLKVDRVMSGGETHYIYILVVRYDKRGTEDHFIATKGGYVEICDSLLEVVEINEDGFHSDPDTDIESLVTSPIQWNVLQTKERRLNHIGRHVKQRHWKEITMERLTVLSKIYVPDELVRNTFATRLVNRTHQGFGFLENADTVSGMITFYKKAIADRGSSLYPIEIYANHVIDSLSKFRDASVSFTKYESAYGRIS